MKGRLNIQLLTVRASCAARSTNTWLIGRVPADFELTVGDGYQRAAVA